MDKIKVIFKGVLYVVFTVFSVACAKEGGSAEDKKGDETNNLTAPYNDVNVQYEGRVDLKSQDGAYLYWPGTAVRMKFSGTGVKAILRDFSSNNDNYFQIIIDGSPRGKLKLDKTKRQYTLASNLGGGEHEVELFKINHMNAGYARGYSVFYGFDVIGDGEVLDAPSLKERKIEFYGNSITCGRSNEDNTGADSPASEYENNYLAYGAITARHFEAQYHCIAMSGIGMTVGYTDVIMPELYDRLNPLEGSRKWDFKKYVPDIVVINLLQNDASILNTPANNPSEFQKRWGGTQPTDQQLVTKYRSFISTIRQKYPQAHIICTLGSMNAVTFKEGRYADIIEDAVDGMDDDKVYVHLFAYKGTSGHPNVSEHREMANSLISFIEENITW
ncbi:SGNH/GDSL hydrolase family protein [Sphingobacterium sp. SGG-5]|uniref:SGNH/GDSL hydrolase family protein n=1 Tax=Sphingobacterium sp. SGG-5 TaxID=2710881 RepID=UPI0013ED6C42|nr:SGNH/GDSL hydrolase family protein [Sphingobacterium sp. SGG-5]NGM60432.1 SGNH/GDSL hydrolase family protein [Sphingobacterium sp. SGG-5]